MAKITLDNTTTGFNNTVKINNNNDTVETHLNDKVLYRDNPSGEPNQMKQVLDMNNFQVINAADGSLNSDLVTVAQLNGASGTTGVIASQKEVQLGSAAVASVFTMSNISFSAATDNLIVSQNGVELEEGPDYTKDAATSKVTMTANVTINASDRFKFRTNSQLTNTTSDTAAITHTQNGDLLNLATHLQNKGVVNVKDKGAVGDGVTDDQIVISSSLADSTDMTLPADHLIASAIDVDVSAADIFGSNAGIVRTSVADIFMFRVGTGSTFETDISIKGLTLINAGTGTNNGFAPLTVRTGNRVDFNNNYFDGTFLGARLGHNPSLSGDTGRSTDCSASFNKFNNIKEMAIENISSKYSLIAGNQIDAPALGTGKWTIRLAGVPTSPGISEGVICALNNIRTNGRGISAQTNVAHCSILGNYIEDAQVGVEFLAGAEGISSSANVTENCEKGVELAGVLATDVNGTYNNSTSQGVAIHTNSLNNRITGVINSTTGNDGLNISSGSNANHLDLVIFDAQLDGAQIDSDYNTGWLNIDTANLGLNLTGNFNNLKGQIKGVAGTEMSVTGDNNTLDFVVTGDVIFDAASSGNVLSGIVTGTITDNGTNNDFSAVRGYSGHGTSAAIATGATIAHGLSATPTAITLLPQSTGPTAIFATADATNITVNYTGGGTEVFYWTAKV